MTRTTSSEDTDARRRAQARDILAQIPWPTDVERVEDQVRRAGELSSEDRFGAQLALLALVDPNSEAAAAARRWHDRQDAIERERLREVIERYETKQRRRRSASASTAQRCPGT